MPQWNEVSEWRNYTLLDMARSMMCQANFYIIVLEYIPTVEFTLNKVSSKSLDNTPYEIWIEKRPGLSFLKEWD
jgi:hypothetical protein